MIFVETLFRSVWKYKVHSGLFKTPRDTIQYLLGTDFLLRLHAYKSKVKAQNVQWLTSTRLKMSRSTQLSQNHQEQINALHLKHWTIRRILVHLSRSRKIGAIFLSKPSQFGMKKRPCRPSKLIRTDRLSLLREAHKRHLCSSELLKTFDLQETPSTVRVIVRVTPSIQYSRMVSTQMVLPRHQIARTNRRST